MAPHPPFTFPFRRFRPRGHGGQLIIECLRLLSRSLAQFTQKNVTSSYF
jgi:hypothetical protein